MDRIERNLLLATLLVMSPLAGCGGENNLGTPTPDGVVDTPTEPAPTESMAPTAPPETEEPSTPTPEETEPPEVTDPPTPVPTPTMVPEPSFELIRTDPESGAWAYNNTRYFTVHFNEPFPAAGVADTDISVAFTSLADGLVVDGHSAGLSEDGLSIRFNAAVAAERDYSYEVTVADHVPVVTGSYSGLVSTRTPCGVGFDLASKEEGRDLTFEQFGSANPVSLASLNAGINSVAQDLVTIFDGIGTNHTLPQNGFTAVAGSVVPVTSNAGSLDPQAGMSGSFDICQADGAGNVNCSGSLLVLPINTGATDRKQLAFMYVRVPTVTASVSVTESGWTMSSLQLRGMVTESDMNYFLANSGQAVGGVLGPIAANNYDATFGGEQALNIVISSAPEPFVLDGCDPSSL